MDRSPLAGRDSERAEQGKGRAGGRSTRSASGAMTAVMQAIAPAEASFARRIPRVALVRGGRVLDERLVKQAVDVTVGEDEAAMFVVRDAGLPPSFSLLEHVGSTYWLRFTEAMSGRVATSEGVASLEALRAHAHWAGDAYRIKLAEDARGKIVLGSTTILFQIVSAPPPQPQPRLPLGVKTGFAGELDWGLTIIAAMSFLLHFGIAGAMYSDWMDPAVETDHTIGGLVEMVERLPKPPPEIAPTIQESAPSTPTADAKPAPHAAPQGPSPSKSNTARPDRGRVDDANAARLAAEAERLTIDLLAAKKSGSAVDSILDRRAVPPIDLEKAAAAQTGVVHGGSDLRVATGGPVGTSKSTLDTVTGSLTRQGNERAGADKATAGPSIGIDTPLPNPPSTLLGVDAVIAGMHPRFRKCYQDGLAREDPGMQGKVVVVASIGPNGEVQSTEIAERTGLSTTVASCVARHIQNAQFKNAGGGVTKLRVPVSFVALKP